MSDYNKDTFLKHRKEQEREFFNKVDTDNPLNSILTIELNTTELCNRTCIFCIYNTYYFTYVFSTNS